ncbi:MAG: zinc ABC transporter substrate-binding protein [Gammaproteobacteria bacterium]|nr:MAG: zinc ABC transporter substrate-binding protein [Gammaproteobacteria bacterium]RLA46086.1 MAG: zinc ABC transporter substrate-binding protein [Gammaproteobacteria bacterium]
MRIILLTALCAVMSVSILAAEQDRLTVYTINYPLQYFAQRIAGEHADVVFPASADVDPAFWQPSTEIIADYQQADLILLNGAAYANWLNRVSLSRRKLVDTSAAFRDKYIHGNEGVTHSHGPDGDHSHTGTAFTTWLDFNQAAEQARAIADAMTRKRPELETVFEHNVTALEADLLALDKQLQSIVATRPDLPLLASHPVYQYFQRRYGLNLHSVMWEPEEVPSEVQWTELERSLKEHPARWMLWEAEPNPDSARRLRDLGVESMVFDPAGKRPNEGDFLSVMQHNVKNLQEVFN